MKGDGGSAFPVVVPGLVYRDGSNDPPSIDDRGMSLRDYFAAKALAGDLAGQQAGAASDEDAGFIAERAYDFADAMMAQRNRQTPTGARAVVADDLFDSLTEFVALYDGTRDMLGPTIRQKLVRAEAALAKASQKEGTS